MSEAKFTKEKWEVVDGTKVGTGVLFVHAPSINGVICRLTHYGNPEIPISEADKANAHLIASAPDMYAMLEKLSGQLTDINAHRAADEVESLLAKARGEV